MKTPELQTKRIILKPIGIEDAPAIQKHFNNWNIIKYLTFAVPWPYPDDGAEIFLRDIALPKVEAGDSHIWGIILKDGPDEVVGLVDYHSAAKDDSGGNRGFWLAEEYWGQGLMSEAIVTVQDWLFFEKGLDHMQVVNAKTNVASRRVKEKTGAKLIGHSSLEHHSGTSETEVWEVTRESWAAYRGRLLD